MEAGSDVIQKLDDEPAPENPPPSYSPEELPPEYPDDPSPPENDEDSDDVDA